MTLPSFAVPYINPDGIQNLKNAWIYNDYLPILLMDKNENLRKVVFQLENLDDPDLYKIIYPENDDLDSLTTINDAYGKDFEYCSKNHLYHPFEILADTGANYFLYGKCGNQELDNFFSTFNF